MDVLHRARLFPMPIQERGSLRFQIRDHRMVPAIAPIGKEDPLADLRQCFQIFAQFPA